MFAATSHLLAIGPHGRTTCQNLAHVCLSRSPTNLCFRSQLERSLTAQWSFISYPEAQSSRVKMRS